MKILKKYIVNREEDFTEGGIKKVRAYITVVYEPSEYPEGTFVATGDIIVVSLNSATGDTMDNDRENSSISYVASL